MYWIKKDLTNNGKMQPVIQSHQPLWNDGTEMPAQVSEFLTTGKALPNYALYLTVGNEENALIVFAGNYYSLSQIEDFLVGWAVDQIAMTPELW